MRITSDDRIRRCDSASIAWRVLQQCKSADDEIPQRIVAARTSLATFCRKKREGPSHPRRDRIQRRKGVDRFQSARKMRYARGARRLEPPMHAKRRVMATSDNKMGDTDEKIFIGKGDQAAWLTLALGKSPWPRHRRDRNRKNRLAAGDGRGICARRRAGVRRRHQGRPLRHLRSGRGQGFYRQAGQRDGPRRSSPTSFRRFFGTCSASRAIRCAPRSPKWVRCCCRA